MWATFNHAKTWGVRPSTLMDMEQPYYAYCFDEAVAMFGNHVVHELEKVEGKTEKEVTRKRHNKLMQLLDAPAEKRFRPMKRPAGVDKVTKKKK